MTDQPKRQWGGARANSGGARPGAGRPRKPPVLATLPQSNDPKVFLLALMNDDTLDMVLRLDAAKALMPYCHAKKVEGIKDEKSQAAHKASTGKFGASTPPVRLVT